MTGSCVIRLQKNEKRCDNCLDVIAIGELAYVRYGKYAATYCLSCYETRSGRWSKGRDMADRKQKMLEMLKDGVLSSRELQDEFGACYLRLVRSLIFDGCIIRTYKRKTALNTSDRVMYRLVQESSADKTSSSLPRKESREGV